MLGRLRVPDAFVAADTQHSAAAASHDVDTVGTGDHVNDSISSNITR